MNVFLDTNVVVDFMAEREPFFDDAAVIFTMIDEGKIHASTSVLTIINCAYLMKKAFAGKDILNKVDILCNMLSITTMEKKHLQDAVKLKPYDFEDAVQFLSAQPFNPDVIITRDERGFNDFNVLVMTPADFVKKAKENRKNIH